MNLAEIKTIVCESFQIEESDFVIFGRQITHSYARFAYFVLCRKHTLETLKTIGESVQMKHQNVDKGIKRHGKLIETRKDYALAYRNADTKVKQLRNND